MTGITLKFRVERSRKSRRTDSYPVFIILENHFDKIKVKLDDVGVSEQELLLWNACSERLESPYSEVNQRIEQIKLEYLKLKLNKGNDFYKMSLQRILDIITLNDVMTNSTPVLVYIRNHYRQAVLDNQSICKGTKKNYNKAINHLEHYIFYAQMPKIRMMDFSRKQAFGFLDYLLSDVKATEKPALQAVSAASVVKKIKAIFQRAYEEEIVERNPFMNMRLVNSSKQRGRLSIDEVAKLHFLDLGNDNNLSIVRDCFLFSIYTGLAYSDLEGLCKRDIEVTSEGYLLDSARAKTDKKLKQFLVQPAIDILLKYEQCETYKYHKKALPVPNMVAYNFKVKVLAEMAGIEKYLSSHIGRHSCMQLLVESGNENPQILNSIMGWSNRNMVSAVYYMVTNDNLIKARDRYDAYLSRHFEKAAQQMGLIGACEEMVG